MITTFTAEKVYEISQKVVEQLREHGLPEVQASFINLGFLNLYAELVSLGLGIGIAEDKNEETTV